MSCWTVATSAFLAGEKEGGESMGPEYFWWSGWWIFPFVMPIVMFGVMLTVLYIVFGRGNFRPPWWNDRDRNSTQFKDSETAIEIIKKRYAKGEITKEEFEQMKEDLLK
jgi:putative membrane protein